jgi:hypothetical protein
MENFERILEIFASRFRQFFPEQEDAKVLFSLYIKSKQNPEKIIFTESEVRELIRKHYKEESESEKEQRKKFFDRLQRLLSSNFLERAKEKQNFYLSQYSKQLCLLFYQRIEPLLNPSEIERTLNDVLQTLKTNSNDIESFNHWFEKDFTGKLETELSNQTIGLDYHIKTLRDDLSLKSQTMDLLEFTEHINKEMDSVVEQRIKLTQAFNKLDSISDTLAESSLSKSGDFEYFSKIGVLNEMLNVYRNKLERSIDDILGIKRIAINIFDIIDKKPFFSKFERFFFTVLENSRTKKITSRIDSEGTLFFVSEIKLPDFVEDLETIKHLPNEYSFPEFYETFSDSKNQKLEATEKNQEKLDEAVRKSQQRRHQAKRIEYWLGNLKERISDKEVFNYADFYLEMLNEEQDLEIAIKGTEHILKTLRKENYSLETTSEFSFNPKLLNNAIWNIRIKKHW